MEEGKEYRCKCDESNAKHESLIKGFLSLSEGYSISEVDNAFKVFRSMVDRDIRLPNLPFKSIRDREKEDYCPL